MITRTFAAFCVAISLPCAAMAQSRATITKGAVGCPTAAATIAVYTVSANNRGGDLRPLQEAIKHHECTLLNKGAEYTLMSYKPLMSVIAVSTYHGFGKKAWLHVPTMYISAH